MTYTRFRWLLPVLLLVLVSLPARAETVRITIRNEAPDGGVALSPFALAAHNGSYDPFNTGDPASLAIENLAELGNGTQLLNNILVAQPAAVTGTAVATQGGFGPGIYRPGASGSIEFDLDPSIHRYLTFGSMVVPSNDAFVGNESPTSVALFDSMGNFIATDFTLTGSDIWDAGTEVNQTLGAAYVAGEDATQGVDEGLTVTMADPNSQFSPYLGSMTPSGDTFSVSPLAASPVVSFSFQVVPEPSSLVLAMLGMISLVAIGVRRRRSVRQANAVAE